MNDFESSWTADEITSFTNNEVKPGLVFLEKEANLRGIDLNLSIKQNYSSLFYIFAYDLTSNRNDSVGSQSSLVAHEMLHLFGAEDFYTTTNRKTIAGTYYIADIMLSASYYIITNNISDATAFYIGWTDEVPDVLYNENWCK